MAQSIVNICNLALSRFGQSKISALNETSREAIECSLNYEPARDAVLREYPWGFAKATATLAEVTYPVIGWDYAYAYPANCLDVRRIYGQNDARNAVKAPYDIVTDGVNKYIVTSVALAQIDFTLQVTDPKLFDPLFVEALSYKLASQLVLPLSGSSQRKSELYQEYKISLPAAQMSSAAETNNQPSRSDSYIQARR